MAENNPSSLVSSNQSSDSGLQIHLHPLVLLTISDHITRHSLRRREEPIVGALLGQHNGRDITLEHAFECQVVRGDQGAVLLHQTWFQDRLQQYKDVHKEPALELVGWFTTAPATGPEQDHVPIHRQILLAYNETAVLLIFHPTDVLEGETQGGKLPLTIYESVYEGTQGVGKAVSQEDDGRDKSMDDVDVPEAPLDLKFRELPYSVDTGEAEMISVDFVARGGGNATNVEAPTPAKGKEKSTKATRSHQEAKPNDASLLSPEDEELITSLTARANAVKMLHSRIQLLKAYLTSLPPSYLSSDNPSSPSTITNGTSKTPNEPSPPSSAPHQQPSPQQPNHSILRSIQALLNRLPLLVPADGAAFHQDSLAVKSDVSLVALLGDLTRGTKDLRELGRKFGTVDNARKRMRPGGRAMASMYEDADEVFEDEAAGMGVERVYE
ncbi:MAG: hypothetical protein Q9219_006500 [cf. Caloplaca sp. 3 TL-2023]